jgi:protein TonB
VSRRRRFRRSLRGGLGPGGLLKGTINSQLPTPNPQTSPFCGGLGSWELGVDPNELIPPFFVSPVGSAGLSPCSLPVAMRIRSPITPSLIASLVWHAAIGLCLVWVMSADGRRVAPGVTPPSTSTTMVFLPATGPGGGAGGGGNETPDPPRAALAPGADRRSVPVAVRPNPAASVDAITPEPPRIALDIPAVDLGSAMTSVPGTVSASLSAPAHAQGPGTDGGAGRGKGRGDGDRQGDSLGNGRGRGADGGLDGGGGGITPPVPLYRGMPRYTAEAAQARIQGSILVECVVETNGRCARARIVRSIEPPFGLDREAIAAANEWRFRPGMRGAEQVPVLVTIEVAFTIR